eukprot:scaffold7446_cov133-Skeletonema_marinoi.AAC.1
MFRYTTPQVWGHLALHSINSTAAAVDLMVYYVDSNKDGAFQPWLPLHLLLLHKRQFQANTAE